MVQEVPEVLIQKLLCKEGSLETQSPLWKRGHSRFTKSSLSTGSDGRRPGVSLSKGRGGGGAS